MKILYSRNGDNAIYDENRHAIIKGKRVIDISPGIILKEGSTIKLDGLKYVVLDQSPLMFRHYAKRGPQIVDPKDAAVMTMYANIKDNSRIIESGTGSGFLTYMILNMVSENGKYLGIDQSRESINITKENVRAALNRDVEILEMNFHDFDGRGEIFDAAILDLPDPWLSANNQKKYIKPGGRIVTYLPNYDQVEKAVSAYENNGFMHIETFEIIKREIIVREGATRPSSTGIMHTAFLSCFVRLEGSETLMRG